MREVVLLTHKFVEFIPRDLEPNTIYVSIPYATAIHNCCCGCGNRVVTPISPTDWELIFDGRSISLEPSIGNWSFPCRSHYWIRNNRVVWSGEWTEDEIAEGRKRDAHAIKAYFNQNGVENPAAAAEKGASKRGKGRVKSKLKR